MRPWLLIVSVVILGWAYWIFEGNPLHHFLTSYLPPCDRVEVELVHVNFEQIDRVIAEKTLTGADADDLEGLWRSQSYTYFLRVNCHAPAYRIRFYEHGSLLTEATVCFHCQNIYFYKYPGASSHDYFEAVFGNMDEKHRGEKFEKLKAYLASLFPGHDVEAETSSPRN